MRIHAHQIYPIVALTMLAGATMWLERVTAVNDPRPADAPLTRPDLVAEQTRLVSYGENGLRRYELLADKVTHFPDRDTTALERPRLRYEGDGRELHVSAERGLVTDQGRRVDLAGDVKARRDAAPGSAAMDFASNTLTIWPDDQRAETHDPVTLTQASTVIRAQGLQADNLFGTLVLRGQVRVNMPRTRRNTP